MSENKVPQVKMFVLSGTVVDKVLNYLTTRPFGEVAVLISSVMQEVQPQMEQNPVVAPVEEKQA